MDRIPSTPPLFFQYFDSILDFPRALKIVEKGGNRWRNFAYLRGRAQKAIICEITRTRVQIHTYVKLNTTDIRMLTLLVRGWCRV